MNEKVLSFDNSVERRRSVAEKCAESGDYTKALGLLFGISEFDKDRNVLMDIADVYADMGLLELSNRYWYKYLDVSPVDKHSVAFEELAINYFYLEDFWASSYYFNKKIEADGYISKEGIDQEILDFFSGEEHKKAFYHVAYPPDKADYSGKEKLAKHAIATGKYADAVKILSAIPEECISEETAGDLAISYYMNDSLDESANVCRESLARHGDNVTAYCNLSTIYDMKKDYEKSEYYYRKALQVRKGERTEWYKIATCAIEREDHKTAKECLTAILEERPFDVAMRLFYGISAINLGEYELAESSITEVYRIDPTDRVVKFYLDYVRTLRATGKDQAKLLPLKYVKELPEKIEKSYIKKIQELTRHPEKISQSIKKKETREVLSWGIRCKNGKTARETAFVLSTAYNDYAKKEMLSVLLDNETLPEIKRVLVYSLTVSGYRLKYGVVAGSIYIKVKPKKIAYEKQDQTGTFVRAYALAMSRVVFWDLNGVDKLANSANNIFKRLNGIVTDSDVTSDELAALMVRGCNFKKFESDKFLAHLFDVKDERFKKLVKLISGDKNGKDN